MHQKTAMLMVIWGLLYTICCNLPPYTSTKIVAEPGEYNKVAYTASQNAFLFYSSNLQKANLYNGYTYQLTNNSFQLGAAPSYLIYSLSKMGNNRLIYGDADGNIYTSETNNELGTISSKLLTSIDGCKVIDLDVANDSTTLAIGCDKDTKVHIHDIETNTAKGQIDFTTIVRGLDWSPSKPTLVVAGGDYDQNSADIPKVALYNVDVTVDPFTSEEIKIDIPNVKNVLSDVAYSDDGANVVCIEITQETDKYVYVYDIQKKTVEQLVANNVGNLQDLTITGDFVTVNDNKVAYVWLITGEFIRYFDSTLLSAGLSPDGSDILTINDNELKLSKICPHPGTTFNPVPVGGSYCLRCISPCFDCFQNTDKCLSCVSGNYINTKAYKCLKCMDACVNCMDGITCDKCKDGFIYENTRCLSCSDKYEGCLTCDATKCFTCNATNHWVEKQDKCECQSGYYSSSKGVCAQCSGVFQWCLQCKSSTICDSCRPPLVFSGGRCQCATNGDTFNPNSGVCDPTQSKLWLVLLIGGIVLVVLCVAGFFLYRRIKQRRQKQSLVDSQDANNLTNMQGKDGKNYNRLYQ